MTGRGGTPPATGAAVRKPRLIEWQPHRAIEHLLHHAADSLQVTWNRGWKRGKLHNGVYAEQKQNMACLTKALVLTTNPGAK